MTLAIVALNYIVIVIVVRHLKFMIIRHRDIFHGCLPQCMNLDIYIKKFSLYR